MGKITLNPQQEVTLQEIKTFTRGHNGWGYLVSGYAGVGKTTMIQQVLDQVGNAILMAPTNKASLVLAEKTGHGAATIHKSIYTVDERTGYFSLNYKFADHALVIVDESSMLSEKLIEDLYTVVVDWHDGKILFLGDPFQLPPVGKVGRTVFQRFTGNSCSTLTQVMRQGEGSAILDMATAMRNVRRTFIPAQSKGDVTVTDYKSVAKAYIQALGEGRDATLITWTNKKRSDMNQYCRRALGYAKSGEELTTPPQIGETLMAISNGAIHVNGETFKVSSDMKIIKQLAVYTREFGKMEAKREVGLCLQDAEGHKFLMLPETLSASVAHQSITNADDFPGGWYTYERGRYHLSDIVTICTWGYAITAHKSQGSQWKEVYVYQCSTMEDGARWLYTAITRASEKLILRDDIASKIAWADIEKAAEIQPSLSDVPQSQPMPMVTKVQYGMDAKDIIKGMNIDF